MTCRLPIGVSMVCLLAGAASGQTLTVDTLEDRTDFGGARQVADLPGPDGRVSFREAVYATNNTPGPQTVEFAIPQSEWWLVDTMALLKLEYGVFLVTDDGTTFDFSTQTDFTGDTNPDGMEVGIYGLEANGWGTPAIIVNADHCVFRGLGEVWQRGASITIRQGSHNRVVGCVTGEIEIDPYPEHCGFNIIGGTTAGDGNRLGEVRLVCGADDNIIVGNRLRTIFVGASPYCDTSSRNRIGGPTPEERNVINGFGYYGEEGFPVGEGIEVSWATDTLIEGNYIGVNAEGTARVAQIGPVGIEVNDSDNTTIRRNLVAGLWVRGGGHYQGVLFGEAIRVNSINRDNNGIVIEGNLIGTDFTGENPIQTLNGVMVGQFTSRNTAHDARIGGTEPGQGNLIAFCERTGVGVGPLIEDAEISGNSIRGNAGLGIDLATWSGYEGVTPNDEGDADTQGGNGLQNFPVLVSAATDGAAVRIEGSLNSRAGREYRIEFFSNGACDPSGHGEGEDFLGFTGVTTDGAGNAAFAVTLPAVVAPGGFITATATDVAAGATSEFSGCVEVAEGGCAADFNADGAVNTLDVLAFLNAWSAGDPAADFNNDGSVNTLDVLAFLNAWSAGC
jgi:hypothetical protein